MAAAQREKLTNVSFIYEQAHKKKDQQCADLWRSN